MFSTFHFPFSTSRFLFSDFFSIISIIINILLYFHSRMVLINSNSTVLSIGDPMPDFSLPATDGMTVDSALIRDAVIAVVFTCNHCAYAQSYIDRLIDLGDYFDGQGVQFVLINSNDSENYPEDSFEMMKIEHDEKGYPFS